MNASKLTRVDIRALVATGVEERRRRKEQVALQRESQARQNVAEAPQRAADILNRLPAAIATYVGERVETPQTFVVMWVEEHEYDGPIERPSGLGFHGPHLGDADQLRLAAATVYNELSVLSPQLKFGIPEETPYGPARLGIFIRLD